MKLSKIDILDDAILFDDKKLTAPFSLDQLEKVLGPGQHVSKGFTIFEGKHDDIILSDEDIDGWFSMEDLEDSLGPDKHIIQSDIIWEENGISAKICKDNELELKIWLHLHDFNLTNHIFPGEILINHYQYQTQRWYLGEKLRLKHFHLFTLLPARLKKRESTGFVKKWDRERATSIVIVQVEPKPPKFTIPQCTEPILKFTNLRFKLLVIQKLMYEKELLKPKFDIYEYANEFEGRIIDPILEGNFDPIPEAMRWFKQYPIPKRFADEITTLTFNFCDDEVWNQVLPNFDGESDRLDIKDISEEELLQFRNLRTFEFLYAAPSVKVAHLLRKHDIEIISLTDDDGFDESDDDCFEDDEYAMEYEGYSMDDDYDEIMKTYDTDCTDCDF